MEGRTQQATHKLPSLRIRNGDWGGLVNCKEQVIKVDASSCQ